jgi:superfamily II DNA helicase RecQ
MIGVGSEFRGVQEEVIRVILDTTLWVLVVISTGGGKSLLFIISV